MVESGLALVLVGLLFLGLQLTLLPRPFGLSTDEATYLAMLDPRVPELYWTAPRAWGTPVLAAPVAISSAGLPVIRLYFALLSTLGVVAAFWPWLRILPAPVAPLGALLFSTTWVTVYYGSLVMPNLYVALGSVAALGWFLRAAGAPSWGRVGAAGAAAGLVAFIRPTDSVVVLGLGCLCALVVPRLRRPGPLLALPIGVALGWLPWVVEAYQRFGGPVARLHAAEAAGPRGISLEVSRLTLVPRMLDGTPMYCCYGGPSTEAGSVPLLLTAWLVAIPTLAALGLVLAARRGLLPELAVLCLPATALAAFYVLLPSFLALRFLLPVFALLSLAVATALVEVLAGAAGRWRAVLAVVLALGLVTHLALMLPKAERVLDVAAKDRAKELQIAAALRPLVQGRPCLVAGPRRAAGFYLGCAVHTAMPKRRLPPRVREALAQGAVVVWAVRKAPAADSPIRSWRRAEVQGMPKGWQVYLPPS